MAVNAASPLMLESTWFEAHRVELVRRWDGKWIVVKGEDPVGVYDTWEQAHRAAVERFPGVPVLVCQITRVDEPVIISRFLTPNRDDS